MPKYSASYEPVHKHVQERIKSMIARNFSTGDLLPKYRDLAKTLGVGLPAVTRAMRSLAEEGIVKPVRRKGTIVNRELKPKDMRLARISLVFETTVARALLRSYVASICGSIFERTEEFRTDIQLASVHGRYKQTRIREILAPGTQGIALLGLSREDYLKAFASVTIPVVSADHDTRALGIPCVICDDGAGTATVVEHLASLGHRHIAYVERDQWNWEVRGLARRAGFAASMKALDLLPCKHPCRLNQDEGMNPMAAQLIRALCSGKSAPTAVVADDEVSAGMFRRLLARQKLGVPEDVSLAASGAGEEMSTPGRGGLTRCQFDFAQMGQRVFDLLELARISPASFEGAVVAIPPTFIQGETTGPPPLSARSRLPG